MPDCACSDVYAAAKEESMENYTVNGFFFDTVISIQFDAGERGDELSDGCQEICRQMQMTFSRTDEDSELYRLNHRTTDSVEVSDDLAELIRVGLAYYEISGGKFDITITPLLELWDFKSGSAVIPDPEKIEKAKAKVDAGKVHLDGNTVSFDSPDTMIDLGALAKGYAADKISAYLKENGVRSGIINLGGNVLAIGSKLDGSPWRIGIRTPFEEGTIEIVEVRDQTVVSSGVYERYFEKDGVIYHHIIDPTTGYPADTGLWGVSIICDSSLMGDALSTTCLLVGEEEGKALIEEQTGVTALFIDDVLEVTRAEGKPGEP